MGMPGHLELLIIGLVCGSSVLLPLIIVVIVLAVNRRQQTSARPCPQCGQPAQQHGFCPHCGAPLDGT